MEDSLFMGLQRGGRQSEVVVKEACRGPDAMQSQLTQASLQHKGTWVSGGQVYITGGVKIPFL